MRACDNCEYGNDTKLGGIICLNRDCENYGLWVGYTACCDEWRKRRTDGEVASERAYEEKAEALEVEYVTDEKAQNVSKDFLEGCFTTAEAIAGSLHDERDAEAVRNIAKKWRAEWLKM